jgi:hypothetical protein
MDEPTRAAIEAALAQLKARADRYQLYEDYYAGRHRLAFATEKFRTAFGNLFRAFAANHMPGVVAAVADRLNVIGFAVEGRPETPPGQERTPDAGDAAWSLWRRNRMDRRAGQLHQEVLRCGDAYAIVWPDTAGRVVIYPQRAEYVTVRYEEETPGRLLWAAKGWLTQEKRFRLTLYYPDRLEKWITRQRVEMLPEKAGTFDPYEAEDGTPPVIVNGYDRVPVFHFANDADLGEFGRCEFHDGLPIQDALNKAICDMLAGMEFVSLPQRWATGLEVVTDEKTGKPVAPFIPGVDKLWVGESKDISFGQFPEANLAQLLQVQDSFRLEIARVTRTPLHYMLLQTDPPSGEALKTQEAPLIKKVEDRQTAFGDTWEDALSFALLIEGTPVPEETPLAAQWTAAAPRSAQERVTNTAALVQAGASLYAAARVAGFEEQEAEELQRTDVVDGVTQ